MLNKVRIMDASVHVNVVAESADGFFVGMTNSSQVANIDDFSIKGSVIDGTTANLIKGLNFSSNGEVFCVLISENSIYFGGSFTSFDNVACKNIVKVNRTTLQVDTTFDTSSSSGGGFDGTVYSIALDSSENVYAGGLFSTYKGTTRQYIAKLNGSTAALDTTFDTSSSSGGGFNGVVNSIALDSSGNVYAGGAFTTYKGTTRQYIAKLNGSTAALDTTFNSASGFDGTIYSIALDSSGNVYVGGLFATYKGTTRERIAKLNGSTAALDTTFNSSSGFNSVVYSIALDSSGDIYAVGGFTGYKGTGRERIAKLNGSTAALDATFNSASGFDNTARFIRVDSSGNVYVGGNFTGYKGTTRQRIAKLNGSTAALDTTFNSASGFDGTVYSIALDSSGNVYAGGSFETYKFNTGTVPTYRYIFKISKSTGNIDTTFDTFNSGFNGAVNSIALDSSGNVYVGGNFTTYKGAGRERIAKLNGSTAALDTTFNSASGFDSVVYSIALDSSENVYAGGLFSTYKGTTRQYIAKLNGSTAALDTTFNSASGFDGTVYSIALDSSGNVYVGGTFNSYKANNRRRIAKLNGSTAALDATFDTQIGFDNLVNSIALDSSGNVYAGGDFNSYKGANRQRIAKLNGSTAALDATFDSASGFNTSVYSIALDSSGNVYAGGAFTTYKGTTRQYIAKLNGSTAALDTAAFGTGPFTIASTETGTKSVKSILISSNKINVGAAFLNFNREYNNRNLITVDASGIPTALNSTPTDISLSSYDIAENAGENAVVGALSATDAEGGAMTWNLVAGAGDTHNSLFNINGSSLRANASFDYENMPAGASGNTLSVRVQATDAGGLSYSKALTINVTNANEAPSGITLSANSITEGNAVGAVIGTLSAIDPDTGDTVTLSVQSGADKFEIVDNQLIAKVAFDYEEATSQSVTIRATDAAGLTRDETFTITIINEATDDPVDVLTAVTSTGDKVYIRSAKNPKTIAHRHKNAPIVEGSVVVYPANGQQKYYKLAGGPLELYQIPITPPAEWGWDEQAVAAWAILQSFN